VHVLRLGRSLALDQRHGIAFSHPSAARGKRAPVKFEQFDFAVNGKHLLDEGSPKMQQPHRERTLVVGVERSSPALKELGGVGTDLDNRRGFAPARGTGFEENAVGNISRTAEALGVSEAIVASKTADGLAAGRQFSSGQPIPAVIPNCRREIRLAIFTSPADRILGGCR
jgi:hypothetical protein